MIRDLGVSRGQISTAYLIGTLLGALLLSLPLVHGLTGLTLGFVGIRLLGQGALGLTATTAAARWFTRRRGTAPGIVSAAGAAGISTAPLLLERLISAYGWRTAWVVEGLLIWAIVIPLAVFAMRDDPAHLGQRPDGMPIEAHGVIARSGARLGVGRDRGPRLVGHRVRRRPRSIRLVDPCAGVRSGAEVLRHQAPRLHPRLRGIDQRRLHRVRPAPVRDRIRGERQLHQCAAGKCCTAHAVVLAALATRPPSARDHVAEHLDGSTLPCR